MQRIGIFFSDWYRENYMGDAGHAVHRAGIDVDGLSRPLAEKGFAFSKRLFAAGHILAHQDWIRSRNGVGLAIATAWKAVEAVEGYLVSTHSLC